MESKLPRVALQASLLRHVHIINRLRSSTEAVKWAFRLHKFRVHEQEAATAIHDAFSPSTRRHFRLLPRASESHQHHQRTVCATSRVCDVACVRRRNLKHQQHQTSEFVRRRNLVQGSQALTPYRLPPDCGVLLSKLCHVDTAGAACTR